MPLRETAALLRFRAAAHGRGAGAREGRVRSGGGGREDLARPAALPSPPRNPRRHLGVARVPGSAAAGGARMNERRAGFVLAEILMVLVCLLVLTLVFGYAAVHVATDRRCLPLGWPNGSVTFLLH